MAPRGCDTRVCMNLIESATFKGSNPFAAAILLPHEKAPASHTTLYDVDTDATLEHCITYMEDHWLKQPVEEAFGDKEVRPRMKDFYKEIVQAALKTPEDDCAREERWNSNSMSHMLAYGRKQTLESRHDARSKGINHGC